MHGVRRGRAALLAPFVLLGCGRIAFDTRTDAPARARSTLVLDRVTPDETLTDFPLPIILDASRADLMRVTAETFRVFLDATELPVEIETAAGEVPFVAWTRVPQIGAATVTLTITYGGEPRVDTSPWGPEYLGVWHMNDSGRDSSPSARTATTNNVALAPGLVGGAGSYTYADESCIVVPSFSTVQLAATTLMGWMRLRTGEPGLFQAMLTRQYDDMAVDDFILGIDFANKPLGSVATLGGGSPSLTGPTPVSAQTWHHMAVTYDGVNNALYVDGVEQDGGPAVGTPRTSPRPLFIGCGRNAANTQLDTPDGDYVEGELDELRIESVSRSAAWIGYTIRAHRDEVIRYGPVEDD